MGFYHILDIGQAQSGALYGGGVFQAGKAVKDLVAAAARQLRVICLDQRDPAVLVLQAEINR